MNIVPDFVREIRKSCGEIAIANGYPRRFGYKIYVLHVADDLAGWSDDEFLLRIEKLESEYPDISSKEKRRMYKLIARFLGTQGEILQLALKSNFN